MLFVAWSNYKNLIKWWKQLSRVGWLGADFFWAGGQGSCCCLYFSELVYNLHVPPEQKITWSMLKVLWTCAKSSKLSDEIKDRQTNITQYQSLFAKPKVERKFHQHNWNDSEVCPFQEWQVDVLYRRCVTSKSKSELRTASTQKGAGGSSWKKE
jgi:hypothetical protein